MDVLCEAKHVRRDNRQHVFIGVAHKELIRLPHKSAAPHRKPPQQRMTLDPKPKENMPSNVELIYAQMRLSALVIQKGGCHLNQATTQGFLFFLGLLFFSPSHRSECVSPVSSCVRVHRPAADPRWTHPAPWPLSSSSSTTSLSPCDRKSSLLLCAGRFPRASSLSRGKLIRRGVCPPAAPRSLVAD